MNLYKLSSVILCTIVIASCGGGGGGNSTPASSDATLSNLTISAGAINPDFQSGTTSYTLSVDNAVASSSVTPTISQSNATVTVNGAAVSSGSASSLIPLTVGKTVLTTVVTAQDGSTTETYTVIIFRKAGVVSRELLDPTPGVNDKFGHIVVTLGNGNIVVSDPFDSSRFATNGAVHLYSPLSSTPIASLFGDAGGDQLGNGQITALPNNNYVISSPNDNENGIAFAGSVRLMSGSTGQQIGATLAGDVVQDKLGVDGITVLANNNYVIYSAFDDENGIVDAGSIRLVDGQTGAQIGATLTGDATSPFSGINIVPLTNNNFVIVFRGDNANGITFSGSVRLINGSTGVQIGSTLAGDVPNDLLGSSGVTALSNNNYVIASGFDDENGIINAGSVRLMNGSTGVQIGSTLTGDVIDDQLGEGRFGHRGVTALSNNNYVIASPNDDENGLSDAGSVRLVNGSSGVQIGSTLAGNVAGDFLGSGGVTALANNNYVIASPNDDENGLTDAGSVRLVNGTSGLQIGATLSGDNTSDFLGNGGVTALSNNNYVIASPSDDENGISDAGSVRLVNGSTGVQIGATLAGDVASDNLGGSSVTALANNNFVIVSITDDENGIVNAGSVRLVNGTSGVQIGATLAGDVENDFLGGDSITALVNDNFVIKSFKDDENGIVDAGSVRLVNGNNGLQIGTSISGENSIEMESSSVVSPTSGDHYILAQPFAENNAQAFAGRVRIIAP